MMPCFLSSDLYSISSNSSAGTAQSLIFPHKPSKTPGSLSAAATPKSAAHCALCPQE